MGFQFWQPRIAQNEFVRQRAIKMEFKLLSPIGKIKLEFFGKIKIAKSYVF